MTPPGFPLGAKLKNLGIWSTDPFDLFGVVQMDYARVTRQTGVGQRTVTGCMSTMRGPQA